MEPNLYPTFGWALKTNNFKRNNYSFQIEIRPETPKYGHAIKITSEGVFVQVAMLLLSTNG